MMLHALICGGITAVKGQLLLISVISLSQEKWMYFFLSCTHLILRSHLFLWICVGFFLHPRYLEWAVIPEWSWPSSWMEENHRHGWYLLLAHTHRHHSVGEAQHRPYPPWTGRVTGLRWPHNFNPHTHAGLSQPLTDPWPRGKLQKTRWKATVSKTHFVIPEPIHSQWYSNINIVIEKVY